MPDLERITRERIAVLRERAQRTDALLKRRLSSERRAELALERYRLRRDIRALEEMEADLARP